MIAVFQSFSHSPLVKLAAFVSIVFTFNMASALAEDGPTKDIVEIAQADGRFSVLLDAARQAGLLEALKGDGPLTLFAPTDDAFAALPEDAVQDLLDPSNRALLIRVLKFHVVPSAILTEELEDETFAQTLEGNEVSIDYADRLYVENAIITQPDVKAANGVIHVIDAVIVPNDLVL